MRLTKDMKSSLVHVIVSTLTFPQTVEEIQKEFNELVEQSLPEDVREFRNKYPTALLRDSLDRHKCRLHPDHSFNDNVCTGTCHFFREILAQPEHPFTIWHTAKMKQMEEWKTMVNDLTNTINQFTTDKQLRETYPEFQQYFNKAGITPSISKLPALTGVTASLKNYGFKEPTGKHTEDI